MEAASVGYVKTHCASKKKTNQVLNQTTVRYAANINLLLVMVVFLQNN